MAPKLTPSRIAPEALTFPNQGNRSLSDPEPLNRHYKDGASKT
ncbi:hypothetical protein E9230_002843 [Corynebacterium glutamicum]|nr:hypothetical protein [Corynebacterium glutamicum]